jgi:hypothetical protein
MDEASVACFIAAFPQVDAEIVRILAYNAGNEVDALVSELTQLACADAAAAPAERNHSQRHATNAPRPPRRAAHIVR